VGARFGGTLRRFRTSRGLSQEALAERAGLAADYLGFIERGENVPTLIVLLKLARALEVDASELVGEFTVAALRNVEL
jgi:transcriptional regulator with XRE-family HTH domain